MEKSGIISGHQKSVDFTQRAIDLLLIFIAWRMHSASPHLSDTTLIMLGLVGMSFELIASLSGLYASHRSNSLGNLLMRTLVTALMAFGVLILCAYLSGRLHAEVPHMLLLKWVVTSIALLCGMRLLYRPVLGVFRQLGLNSRQACIIGDGPLARALIDRLQANPWMGIRVTKIYAAAERTEFLAAARLSRFDNIYLALPIYAQAEIQDLITELADTASSVYLVPDLFTFDLLNARTELIDGLPTISIYDTPFHARRPVYEAQPGHYSQSDCLAPAEPLVASH